jgi:hypothetical protein
MKDTRNNMIGGGCIAFDPGIASRDGGHVYDDISGTLRKDPGDNQMTVAIFMNEKREVIPIHDCATRHEGKDGTGGTAGKGHGIGIAGPEDPMFTLTNGDKHAVAIGFDEAQITSKANRTKAADGLPASTLSADSRMMVAHTLKAEGVDASEDGTGRGVPLVPEIVGALSDGAHMGGGLTARTRTREESLPCVSSKWSKGTGGPAGDECQNLVAVLADGHRENRNSATLQGGFFNAAKPIAFSSKDHGADAGELSPTLRASGHDESHANAGAPPAIAFPARMSATQRATSEEVCPAIGSVNPTAVGTVMAVRRLTPRECERLQGFPDDFTLVAFNGKPACDGPRYKAIGNSMAVPNIEWIGRRMELVDELVPV